MRLSTLQSFRVILQKRFDSLDKVLTTNPASEILTIRTRINTIMHESMTPADAQSLADLGRRYNDMLRLEKRQAAHWDEWQKERRALANEIAELVETIKLKTPAELFDGLNQSSGDGEEATRAAAIPGSLS